MLFNQRREADRRRLRCGKSTHSRSPLSFNRLVWQQKRTALFVQWSSRWGCTE